MGKHAHAVRLSADKTLVAWDDSADKSFTLWGVLDARKGLLQKGAGRDGLLYPIVTVNNQIAVIAAMQPATHQVVTFAENLNSAAGALSSKK
jgi:hypothetical protein